MYRKHFGLTRHPFTKDLMPDELFVAGGGKELEVRLGHLLELRGIGLVTGEAGSGKTTLCRKVVSSLHTGLYRVFYVPLSTGNAMDMYKCIAWELGLPTERSRAALYRVIRAEVTRLCLEAKVRPILVVDEAQHLRSDVLEELRLLTNYEMDSQNRLCLLLVGQAELRRRIGMAVHAPLSQRIVVRYHLDGLARDELPSYLAHLLRLAGTELPLFEASAVEALFQATSGLLRKVNLLAHHSLNAAALAKAKAATAEHVQAAWALLSWLDASVGTDCDLVLPDWLARSEDIARFALERGGAVWLVPVPILEAVHVVAHLATGPPARAAAALARLPLAGALRAHLRRLTPPPTKQMPLF